jgi:tetratricopeptide (TPR) repeat protein
VAPYNGFTALAEILALQNNAAAARQAMTDALGSATSGYDSVQYLQVRAGADLLIGDQRAALQEFDAIGRIWPTLPDNPGFDLAPLYAAALNAIYGDRRSVTKYLAQIHVVTPSDTVGYEMSVANVYAYAGQADSTFKYADRLAARAPSNAIAGQVAHFTRGELFLQTRRCDKALDEFRQGDSTWVEIQQGIAECELQLGHREVGLRWRDRVLARRDVNLLDPGEIHARLRAAQLR